MVKRPDVNYPKFKDQFAVMDFEAETMPVLSLYPMPAPLELCDWELKLTDTTSKTTVIRWEDLQRLPKVQEPTPLVCQIFNWSETPEVTGVRLNTVLEAAGLNASSAGYLAFYSADGMYFESLPKTLTNDPRMLLVYEICGEPLPHELGGPVRLWAPFLQGYKSVKWLRDVRSFVRDPMGIKRLLGQSKTAVLGAPGQQKASVVVAKVGSGLPTRLTSESQILSTYTRK